MAGAPRKKAMRDELERRARKYQCSVLEYAEDWVGSGKTLLALAQDITTALRRADSDLPPDYVTRNMVSGYLNGQEGGAELLKAARKEGGHALADESIEIVDEAAESREEVARNKVRAEQRLKIAGFWNRQEYGVQDKNSVNLNLNLGQLHLDELRRRELPSRTEPILPPAEPDVEIVND